MRLAENRSLRELRTITQFFCPNLSEKRARTKFPRVVFELTCHSWRCFAAENSKCEFLFRS